MGSFPQIPLSPFPGLSNVWSPMAPKSVIRGVSYVTGSSFLAAAREQAATSHPRAEERSSSMTYGRRRKTSWKTRRHIDLGASAMKE
jgi:hypothetical protein